MKDECKLLQKISNLETEKSELETRIAELEAAVEWMIDVLLHHEFDATVIAVTLRARAFPPKFVGVEIVRWECMNCGDRNLDPDVRAACCANPRQIMLTGHYQRPIVAKVKHREEVKICNTLRTVSGTIVPASALLFAEW